MARNPLTNFLKSAFADSVSLDPELEAGYKKWNSGRRSFIKNLALTIGSAALFPSFIQNQDELPTIIIVGAGMAGLNAAYQLNKLGIKSTVYEASARAGGRMFTMHDYFGKGITTDIGGEFVDTTHNDILQLAKEFNLSFYDLREDKLSPKTFYFDGKHLDQSDLRKAIAPFAKQIASDILSLPPLIDHSTAGSFRHFDELSITEYLSSIGIQGWLFDFLNVVLTREYGLEASEQSAINFLIMFVPPLDTDADYQLFGPTHEVFKIKGGSQHLTEKLYESLKNQVFLNQKLSGIQQREKGGYDLMFTHQDQTTNVRADYVLITIPFTILREISFPISMPAEKRKCIDELGYGNSCKFVMGFSSKPWRKANQQGYTFTNEKFGAGWDSSQMQSTGEGSFTVFGGGQFGEYLKQTKELELAENCIGSLDVIYPGAEQVYTKKNIKFSWAANPHSKAGYSVFKKGQWSSLSGWEGVPVGNIFFAGEHVSKEFQGYMNGAAETARIAVEGILKKINNN
jgi:monoamine oxidase